MIWNRPSVVVTDPKSTFTPVSICLVLMGAKISPALDVPAGAMGPVVRPSM
ncbi:hypothetical protein D3C71_1880530 [compost metagenome]